MGTPLTLSDGTAGDSRGPPRGRFRVRMWANECGPRVKGSAVAGRLFRYPGVVKGLETSGFDIKRAQKDEVRG